jgi:L-threonine kinase
VELDARYWPSVFTPHLLRINREIVGLGLVRAHSGTVTGVLVADEDPDYQAKIEGALVRCRALHGQVSVHHSLCLEDRC